MLINFKKIFTLLILVLSVGCQDKVSEKILHNIKSEVKAGKNKVIISISDFTDFDWDIVYIFSGGYSNNEITKIIGTKYEGYVLVSDGIQMIFLKNNQVVFTDVNSDKIKLQFNKLLESDYVPTYNYENCSFLALKEPTYEGSKRFFHNLVPINP